MRVLLVTSNPNWEGTEAQVASLAAAFRRDPHVSLHAALFHPGVLADTLAAADVPVEILPVRSPLDLGAVHRLARLLRSRRIDVLHSHGYKANVIGALAARMAGVPAVVRTEHGLPEPFRGFRRAKMDLYLWLDRLAGRHLTQAVIGVSQDVASHARQRFPKLRVACIPNGISPEPPPRRDHGDARTALGIPAGGPVVGVIGRLAPVKDHATFLAAAKRVAAAEPTTHFVLAGQGQLQEALEAQAAALGLLRQVHFLYLPGGIQIVLDALDALAFSSLHEGIPYALLEALRSEVPVVATRVGGLSEVLTHGQNGLLVPPRDPDAMAAALLRVVRDWELARQLRARGRLTLDERFSLRRMGEQTRAVYAEAIQLGRGASRKQAGRIDPADVGRDE